MNGLVSGYGSDSDDEEANSSSSQIQSKQSSDWMECMDNTTGYPYFWNRVTNEVRWDRPAELPAPILTKNDSNNTKNYVSKERPSSTSSRKRSNKSPPQVFIGPTLPQLTPEEIARQKVIKFEESMAKDIEKEILKEEPLDWKTNKPQRGLYSKPFAWKKTLTTLQTHKQLESSLKKASQSISLIAGVYGDDEETDETDEESPPKKKERKGVSVKVQKPASKQTKPLLKDIPGIFKVDDDEAEEDGSNKTNGDNNSEDPPKKKRRWDMKDRTYVNSTAEKLCQKLEALEVAKIAISPLKLLAVQAETLFAAWQNGALSNSYLQTSLDKMSAQMLDIESHHLAPPGWRAVWDRAAKKYAYENLITRETQFEKPVDEEDEDEEEPEITPNLPANNKDVDEGPPPLPPTEEAPKPPLPPPPPAVEENPPLPTVAPKPESQVEDMELSDEETVSAPIETSTEASKPKEDNLSDALSSFYSDLASMDGVSQESTPVPTPPQIHSPGPSNFVKDSSPALSDERSNSPLCYGESADERKKRKTTKISSGLSMKRKNVGSLVAKWQNIQQEVKRNK